jgi:hypothetical protein
MSSLILKVSNGKKQSSFNTGNRKTVKAKNFTFYYFCEDYIALKQLKEIEKQLPV